MHVKKTEGNSVLVQYVNAIGNVNVFTFSQLAGGRVRLWRSSEQLVAAARFRAAGADSIYLVRSELTAACR